MKTLICAIIASATIATGFSQSYYTSGYTKRDGTYVQGHYRSLPDSNINNNWSTQGNFNPYTGAAGTRTPSYGTGFGSGFGSSYGTRVDSYGNIYGR